MPWDEKVPENIISRIIEELSYFYKIETVEFQWKAVFSEADEVRFKIYFDGSKEMIGISVVVRSNFPNKKVQTGGRWYNHRPTLRTMCLSC